jgi:phosphoribosylaminoimidazole-succinocarboxamide synthase
MNQSDCYLGRAEKLGDLRLLNSGKVRDIYSLGDDQLCFVTSDRISAFDVIMPEGVPYKGRILTTIAAHWFERTRDIIPNHLVSTNVDDLPGLSAQERDDLRGRIMLVDRCEPTSVEWVVRGYIAGSGWKEYQKQGTICGVPLPGGLQFVQKLPEPILTPTTKDDVHDLPLTPDEARERVGAEIFDPAQAASMALFAYGTKELERLGILLADTKFEFGLVQDQLTLIDEVFTPDSTRYWLEADYEPGRSQEAYDKQVIRDALLTLDWDKKPPAPELPQEVLDTALQRYIDIERRLIAPEDS